MDSDRGLLELWRISGGVRLLGVSGDWESRFCGLKDCGLRKGFKGGRLRSGFDDTGGGGGGGGGRLLVGSLVKAALGVMGEGPLRSETLRPLESSPYIVADCISNATTTPIPQQALLKCLQIYLPPRSGQRSQLRVTGY